MYFVQENNPPPFPPPRVLICRDFKILVRDNHYNWALMKVNLICYWWSLCQVLSLIHILQFVKRNFSQRYKSVVPSLHLQDWQSVDREAFTIRANNQRSFKLKEAIKEGNYNILMQNQPLYNSEAHTFESSHNLFRSAFSEGFPWELLEVFSGNDQFTFSRCHSQDTWMAESGKSLGREREIHLPVQFLYHEYNLTRFRSEIWQNSKKLLRLLVAIFLLSQILITCAFSFKFTWTHPKCLQKIRWHLSSFTANTVSSPSLPALRPFTHYQLTLALSCSLPVSQLHKTKAFGRGSSKHNSTRVNCSVYFVP